MKKFLMLDLTLIACIAFAGCKNSPEVTPEKPKKVLVKFTEVARNAQPNYYEDLRYEIEVSKKDGTYLATVSKPNVPTKEEYAQIYESYTSALEDFYTQVETDFKTKLKKESPDISQEMLEEQWNSYRNELEVMISSTGLPADYEEYINNNFESKKLEYFETPWDIEFSIDEGTYQFELYGYNRKEYAANPEKVVPVVYGKKVAEVKIQKDYSSEIEGGISDGQQEEESFNDSMQKKLLEIIYAAFEENGYEIATDDMPNIITIDVNPIQNEYTGSAVSKLTLEGNEIKAAGNKITVAFRYTTTMDYITNSENASWITVSDIKSTSWENQERHEYVAGEDGEEVLQFNAVAVREYSSRVENLEKGSYYMQWVVTYTDNSVSPAVVTKSYVGDIFDIENGMTSNPDYNFCINMIKGL